jgi:hypothetical protein
MVGKTNCVKVEGMLRHWKEKTWAISNYRGRDHLHFQVMQFETDSLKDLEVTQ